MVPGIQIHINRIYSLKSIFSCLLSELVLTSGTSCARVCQSHMLAYDNQPTPECSERRESFNSDNDSRKQNLG